MNNEIDHKSLATADIVRLLGELQHFRQHAILALTTAPDDKKLGLLVLANRCQELRRKLQRKYFPELKPWGWCMVKSAAQLWELAEELCLNDPDEFVEIKNLVDEGILLTTGEDISNCSACVADGDGVE